MISTSNVGSELASSRGAANDSVGKAGEGSASPVTTEAKRAEVVFGEANPCRRTKPMNTPPDQYVDLARALAELPSRQNDEALKAGGLPVDERCRTIIENGIQEIKRRCEQWKTMEQEPELAKALADIAEAGENLLRKAESDAGRQAIAILANEDNWYYPVNFPRYRENIEFLTRAARFL